MNTKYKQLVQFTIIAAALAMGTSAAYAKSHHTKAQRTHHCKLSDGTVDAGKTHKQCTAAKGTWAKDTAPAAESVPPAAEPAKN